MTKKRFKIASALGMLLVYLVVLVAGNTSVLLCDCHLHRHVNHIEVDEHHHCSCGMCHSAGDNASIDEQCGCSHDHSNKVELYTFSRDWSDTTLRLMLQPALVTVAVSDVIADSFATEADYGEYLLPPLSAVEKGCAALRAPPALV